MDESRKGMPFLNRRLIRAAIATLFALLTLNLASAARAQDDSSDNTDAIAKATQLNKDALAAFQAHKTDEAKRLLKQALDLCDASGLDQHPIKARTLVHFGMVLIGGQKQRDPAIKQFKKALAIEPGIGLTKSVATPEMQSAFDEARKAGAAAAADTQSETKPTAPDSDATPAGDATPSGGADNAAAAAPEPPPPPPPPPAPAAEPESAAGAGEIGRAHV